MQQQTYRKNKTRRRGLRQGPLDKVERSTSNYDLCELSRRVTAYLANVFWVDELLPWDDTLVSDRISMDLTRDSFVEIIPSRAVHRRQ